MPVAVAYVAMVTIWSTVPLSLKWSLGGTTFLSAVASRILIATVFVTLVSLVLRRPLPLSRPALQTYCAAAVNFLSMAILYWGARFIPSGWIAVMFGSMPLLTAVMSALWLGDRSLTFLKVTGLLVGIAGLLVIFATAVDFGPDTAKGMGAAFVAVCFASATGVWIKGVGAGLPGLTVATGGLLLALPVHLGLWALGDGRLPADLPPRTVLATFYIGIVGTGVVFSLMYFAIKHLEITRVALIGMICPVLGLMLGIALNGEPLSARIGLGTALIVAALLLHEYLPRRLARRRVREAEHTELLARYD